MLFLHVLVAVLGITSSSIRSALFLTKGFLNPLLQKMVWLSLPVLFATGFGLLLANPVLLHDPAFLIKMFFVSVVIVSEFYLVRKKTVWAGFASLFSWYYTFLWSGLLGLNVSYLGVLGFYSAIILLSFFLAHRYGYS
ncbi:hypothetical protein A2797_01060 [candidate division WWE3 bacterium RIFCSPHIGHO2_01_FULL_48_15]|uniref:Uncharacterized protein n=1 Tax=candidate division WWE3 bacterium RIFCSPHIGHO2_01_FULL_48_15 TaxID=1802619 RepID=A0A1F4VF95_UNCKA|nr:MAG: hypothetical protein A2797_01060 [candidate division WWE3 bacterium RIFCSPHIGHO2_01_FULL_48_15]